MTYKDEAAACAERRVARIHKSCGGDAAPMREGKKPSAGRMAAESKPKIEHLIGEKGAKRRLDRAGYAKGGSVKGKGAQINIIVDAGKGGMGGGMPDMPMGPGGAMPAAPPPAAMAMGRPPMGAMPPGAMPPGAIPPGMPMRKRGGKVGDYDAGSGSGLGRLEKAAKYGAKT